jgi:hypothetical protein
VALTAAQPTTLRALVQRIAHQLADDRLVVTDMSRAGSLELDPTLSLDPGGVDHDLGEIHRLEGAITGRPVLRHDSATPIRYFLDGSQKTLPVWRVGTMPVVVSITAAGILRRVTPDAISLCDRTLVDQVQWILPLHTGHPALERIAEALQLLGQRVVDPLDDVHQSDAAAYHRQVSVYAHLLERSLSAAKVQRERIEAGILSRWWNEVSPRDPEGWIVVDGRLRSEIPLAIGLVKDVQAQHLFGEEAVALYDLPVGHRTGAYTLVDADRHAQWMRAMWYLRMQNANGQDARHGLIRLESSAIVAEPDLTDHISSWILAERAPRASADSRWATLLYPIHLLERMLKRRIQTITAGWPG